ncbi:MFS transporter [Oceanobacillus senegalensis]|uniref:MFS transporter n=1 Tax=Oceanobacillus senegalensis TaxID=1936063 RepID=UPI001FE4FD97|nr:MFS transporter [Oceanobacillus senegalensis]
MSNRKPKLWTKDFIMVSTSNFLLFISFYMLMVTLAFYAVENFNASESAAGLASSIFVLGAVLVRPVAGKIIEAVGKKKLLVIGLSMFFGCMLLYFPIQNLEWLLLIRFLHGFSFGISTTATGTIAADIIPMVRRGEGMGYFATSMNLAMAIGPFLGLLVIQNLQGTSIFVVTTIFATIALIAALFLQVPILDVPEGENKNEKGFRFSDYFEKSTIPIGVLMMVSGFVYSSILTFMSAYAAEINLVDAASFFFVMYAIFLLLSRPLTGRIFDEKGENAVIYPSILLYAIGLVILSQANVGWILLVAGAIIGIGFGTLQSSAQTVSINLAKRHRVGLATSTFFVFYDFGIGVGPFLLGFIVPIIGFRSLYLLMAIIAFGTLFVYYIVHGKKAANKQKEEQETETSA